MAVAFAFSIGFIQPPFWAVLCPIRHILGTVPGILSSRYYRFENFQRPRRNHRSAYIYRGWHHSTRCRCSLDTLSGQHIVRANNRQCLYSDHMVLFEPVSSVHLESRMGAKITLFVDRVRVYPIFGIELCGPLGCSSRVRQAHISVLRITLYLNSVMTPLPSWQ